MTVGSLAGSNPGRSREQRSPRPLDHRSKGRLCNELLCNYIDHTIIGVGEVAGQEPVPRKTRKLFGPGKPSQNLEPYDRLQSCFLFTYSYMNRGSLQTRIQAHTFLHF